MHYLLHQFGQPKFLTHFSIPFETVSALAWDLVATSSEILTNNKCKPFLMLRQCVPRAWWLAAFSSHQAPGANRSDSDKCWNLC